MGINSADCWPAVLAEIKKRVSASQFRTWFQGLELRDWEDDRLTIVAPSRYTMDWIARHFRPLIEEAGRQVAGRAVALELEYSRANLLARRQAQTERPPAVEQPPPGYEVGEIQLNDTYTFDNFVVGPCNHLAHAAAMAVADAPALSYNPLYLHGNVGLGKTHLLQAICHSALLRKPDLRLHYISCETFVNQFISAIGRRDLESFRQRYRSVDLLLIDDIHFLAQKERTQEEFFHTFNALYNAKKQIVLSSDSPPKEIPTLEDRLISRFKWGLVTRFDAPAFETRVAILDKKARLKGYELRPEVAAYIAEHVDSNIRELEGAINRMIALAALQRVEDLTLAFAQACLRDLFEVNEQVSVGDIIDVVTREFDCKQVDLQSRRRTRRVSFPRHICMYLAKKMTGHSLEEIGRHFGGRDHSTVVYAISAVRQRMKQDEETRNLIGRLENLVVRTRRPHG